MYLDDLNLLQDEANTKLSMDGSHYNMLFLRDGKMVSWIKTDLQFFTL